MRTSRPPASTRSSTICSSAPWKGATPRALFDTAAYLAANPDVAAAGVNPLLHFLNFGRAEGRSALGQAQTSVRSAEDEDHVFAASEFNFGGVDEILSVTIDASGIGSGTLFVDANDDGVIDPGEALSGPGNVVSFPDIDAGRLVFRPAADGSGDFYGKFTYTGTDGSATSATAVMTVNVSPVNDAPRTITFAQPNLLIEGSLGGVVVGQATGSDPEDGAAVAYSLRNGDGSPYAGPLAINASTGIVTVATGANGDTIDFETSEGGTLEFVVR